MKYVRVLFAVALVFMVCSAFSFKKGKGDKEKAVYAFGVAASFNDTVVYFTDIQALDSVKLDKNGFLPKRDLYTYQLKNYLEYDLRCLDYTCMIYFSENKKKLEKEAAKVKSKYKKNKTIVLMPVASEAFRFKKPEE
ncbi:hypothetical protein [Bacteroides oleiciplenus]|uniref:Uncharacterized protein n=1 Tax=Bacteroides oleiciplenus TaxID=626931 RepID=A0A3E5B723_9BACE|nr:hypothetical protein [Bacteroides oleiciplenus]RGN33401.1 hypothetical protein DXB65_16720 [Bacteroides oleiciplenus]